MSAASGDKRLANTRALAQPRFVQAPWLVGTDARYRGIAPTAVVCNRCLLLAAPAACAAVTARLLHRPEETALLKNSATSRETLLPSRDSPSPQGVKARTTQSDSGRGAAGGTLSVSRGAPIVPPRGPRGGDASPTGARPDTSPWKLTHISES